jgi:SAM-dependent methyltransferase
MTSKSSDTSVLDDLAQIAYELDTKQNKSYLAHQIQRAIDLARALDLQAGQEVLVVNPPLGNPWPLETLRTCGCTVTALCDNKKLLNKIAAEQAGLSTHYEATSDLGKHLAVTAARGELEFRKGPINLFFPEEDRFDLICLLAVSWGEWGFGPDALLHNCLRGLREKGKLMSGFLDTELTDPAVVASTAAAGGFRLDQQNAGTVQYEAYTPAGLLFTLREKAGRSVGFELITRASEDLDTEAPDNPADTIQEAIKLAQDLEIQRGCRILVIGRTTDFWLERVMAAVAGKIDIVLTDDEDLDEVKSEFSFYPGIAAVEGGLEMQAALRNPKNKIYNFEFLKPLVSLKAFDLVCLFELVDKLLDELASDRSTLRACLEALQPGARLLVGADPSTLRDCGDLPTAAAAAGIQLNPAGEVETGPLQGVLFVKA